MAQQRFLPDNQITLPLKEIQGDILIGLQKKAQVFDFYTINDAAAFAQDLTTILNDVTFSDETKDREENRPAPFMSMNVAFSISGLKKVRSDTPSNGAIDPAFVEGAAARAGSLGDDVIDWLDAYKGSMDLVVLVTALDLASAQTQADAFANALRHSTTRVRRELGLVRSGAQAGHEHFGFADGVSQPGVKGLTLPGADPTQGWPGQDLVDPGDFIFGDYDRAAGGKATPPVSWMENGSYMVFRRLRQDVAGFDAWVQSNVGASKSTDADQLGAKLVGRWADGSPLVLSPAAADPNRDSSHPQTNNDFNFGEIGPDADPHQISCPFSAHIRKVYPRDDLANEASEQRRILRAGIPFGADGDFDKGLLFVCYQTSISDKFEFIQQNWADNSSFIFGKTTKQNTPIASPGLDPIIGQGGARNLDQTSDDTRPTKLNGVPAFVTTTGAGYFFSPSRSTLAAIARD